MKLQLKVNIDDSIEIVDSNQIPQRANPFFVEIRREKTEKLSTPRFLAECLLKQRLSKNQTIVFKDGNETNLSLNNMQIITLSNNKNNIIYIAISIEETEKHIEYKSISSISRALGIRGVIIKGCIEGIIEKVKSPKTNKIYRFEQRVSTAETNNTPLK